MLFEWRTYRRLVRLVRAEHKSPRRRRIVYAALVGLPLIAAFDAVCWWLDWICFPGLRRVEVREPVFIIGHARSGTSLMHRLMTRDERLSWFMTWELFAPSLLQKKLVRALAAADRRWLAGRVARRIRAWEDRVFEKGRGMHPMSLTGPEEDEFVLAAACASPSLTTLFPYLRELDYLYYVDQRPLLRREAVLGFYRDCVRRQLYVNGPDKLHLGKNPVFSGKLESLIETFPDARFVVMVRNPWETVPSLLKLMERNWRASDCAREVIDDSLAVLAQQSFHTYLHPFEVLARHPRVRHAVVDYRELVRSPRRVVREVYAELGLELSPQLEKSLEAEEARHASHRAEHVYDLREFGLTRAEIRAGLAELFERFGWDDEARGAAP